jgi:hypothetical protein
MCAQKYPKRSDDFQSEVFCSKPLAFLSLFLRIQVMASEAVIEPNVVREEVIPARDKSPPRKKATPAEKQETIITAILEAKRRGKAEAALKRELKALIKKPEVDKRETYHVLKDNSISITAFGFPNFAHEFGSRIRSTGQWTPKKDGTGRSETRITLTKGQEITTICNELETLGYVKET